MIELESYKAKNLERISNGMTAAYDEASIFNLIDEYNLDYSSVVITLYEGS